MSKFNRFFNFQTELRNNTKGGVLDIPHLSVLKYLTPKELLDRFEETWGVEAEAVVLPIVSPEGLLFDIKDLTAPISRYAESFAGDLEIWEDIVEAFINLDKGIYLSVDPTFPFVETDALHIIDIVNDGAAHLCITNPKSQDLIGFVLGTAIDKVLTISFSKLGKSVLRGLVIDIVNTLPMGATNQTIEATCFCQYCEQEIKKKQGPLDLLKTLKSPAPNAWNLLLQPTPTGMANINDIQLEMKPEDIVRLSKQKGFARIFGDKPDRELAVLSTELLEYIRIRHEITVDSVGKIFKQALDGLPQDLPKITRVILAEGIPLSWTTGIQLLRLDLVPPTKYDAKYDEVWFDPSSAGMIFQNVPFRSYMWRRSRYYLDEFFQFVASVGDPVKRAVTGVAHLTEKDARTTLQKRFNQAYGTKMTGKTSLASLPELFSPNSNSDSDSDLNSYRVGFVGVAIVEEGAMSQRFIDDVPVAKGLADLSSEISNDFDHLPNDFAQLVSRLLADQSNSPGRSKANE